MLNEYIKKCASRDYKGMNVLARGSTKSVLSLTGDDKYVLKVGHGSSLEGKMLSELRGSILLPRVYYINESGCVMDRVKGKNLSTADLTALEDCHLHVLFSELRKIHNYGYTIDDLHSENIFLDESGRFYLIDIDRYQLTTGNNFKNNRIFATENIVEFFYQNTDLNVIEIAFKHFPEWKGKVDLSNI